jgi:hypothetical protein
VEGSELAVLHGGKWLIESARPDLVIEISADEMIRQAIWHELTALGYHGFVLSDTGDALLRPLADQLALMKVSPGWNFDAVFTVDESLNTMLDAKLTRS